MPNTIEKEYNLHEDMTPEISSFDCCVIMNTSTHKEKNHDFNMPPNINPMNIADEY